MSALDELTWRFGAKNMVRFWNPALPEMSRHFDKYWEEKYDLQLGRLDNHFFKVLGERENTY